MSVPANQQHGRKFESPGHYTEGDREKMDASEFGDPDNKNFPIVTVADVMDAAHLIGRHPILSA